MKECLVKPKVACERTFGGAIIGLWKEYSFKQECLQTQIILTGVTRSDYNPKQNSRDYP